MALLSYRRVPLAERASSSRVELMRCRRRGKGGRARRRWSSFSTLTLLHLTCNSSFDSNSLQSYAETSTRSTDLHLPSPLLLLLVSCARFSRRSSPSRTGYNIAVTMSMPSQDSSNTPLSRHLRHALKSLPSSVIGVRSNDSGALIRVCFLSFAYSSFTRAVADGSTK